MLCIVKTHRTGHQKINFTVSKLNSKFKKFAQITFEFWSFVMHVEIATFTVLEEDLIFRTSPNALKIHGFVFYKIMASTKPHSYFFFFKHLY